VAVHAGDVLYLPAIWYHHVAQLPDEEHGWVVAVNYWHDMRFDVKYGHFRLVEELSRLAGLAPDVPAGPGEDGEGGGEGGEGSTGERQ
jgi:jumonji domain-containing protein 7